MCSHSWSQLISSAVWETHSSFPNVLFLCGSDNLSFYGSSLAHSSHATSRRQLGWAPRDLSTRAQTHLSLSRVASWTATRPQVCPKDRAQRSRPHQPLQPSVQLATGRPGLLCLHVAWPHSMVPSFSVFQHLPETPTSLHGPMLVHLRNKTQKQIKWQFRFKQERGQASGIPGQHPLVPTPGGHFPPWLWRY